MRVLQSHLKPMRGHVHILQLQPYERPVPERRDTLAIQVQQLVQGMRKVVFFPRGQNLMKRPKGIAAVETPQGTYFYDPKRIDSRAILQAEEAGRLNEILGAAAGGMGPQSKADIDQTGKPAVAVVGRDRRGTVTQGTLATPDEVQPTVRQTEKVTPKGGKVSIEDPKKTVADRKRNEKHKG